MIHLVRVDLLRGVQVQEPGNGVRRGGPTDRRLELRHGDAGDPIASPRRAGAEGLRHHGEADARLGEVDGHAPGVRSHVVDDHDEAGQRPLQEVRSHRLTEWRVESGEWEVAVEVAPSLRFSGEFK